MSPFLSIAGSRSGDPALPRLRRLVPLLALAATVVVSLPIRAAEPPLSLAETLSIAVERSAQLGAQRASAEAAREMVTPAGELPDPKLRAGVENVPTQGSDAWSLTRDFMTMSKIGLMQEFPGTDKRRLKMERAERDAERGAAAVEAAATRWTRRSGSRP